MKISMIILLSTIISLALMAGLFYSFSISVMPGLGRTSDRTFMEAMQAINRAIINPYFMIAFIGSIILVIMSSILKFRQGVDLQFYLIATASFIFLAGTIGVTFFGNVPLNNVLDSIKLNDLTVDDLKLARNAFENRWNSLNLVRTSSSIVALVLYLVAILKNNDQTI